MCSKVFRPLVAQGLAEAHWLILCPCYFSRSECWAQADEWWWCITVFWHLHWLTQCRCWFQTVWESLEGWHTLLISGPRDTCLNWGGHDANLNFPFVRWPGIHIQDFIDKIWKNSASKCLKTTRPFVTCFVIVMYLHYKYFQQCSNPENPHVHSRYWLYFFGCHIASSWGKDSWQTRLNLTWSKLFYLFIYFLQIPYQSGWKTVKINHFSILKVKKKKKCFRAESVIPPELLALHPTLSTRALSTQFLTNVFFLSYEKETMSVSMQES